MEDRHLNLLLVDDDAVDVMNVERAFQKNNPANSLYIASNGLEALAMLWGKGPMSKVPAQRLLILLDLKYAQGGWHRIFAGAMGRWQSAGNPCHSADDFR